MARPKRAAVFFQLLGLESAGVLVLINRLAAGPRTATAGARRIARGAERNMAGESGGKLGLTIKGGDDKEERKRRGDHREASGMNWAGNRRMGVDGGGRG